MLVEGDPSAVSLANSWLDSHQTELTSAKIREPSMGLRQVNFLAPSHLPGRLVARPWNHAHGET